MVISCASLAAFAGNAHNITSAKNDVVNKKAVYFFNTMDLCVCYFLFSFAKDPLFLERLQPVVSGIQRGFGLALLV